jgi:hypothetical protein
MTWRSSLTSLSRSHGTVQGPGEGSSLTIGQMGSVRDELRYALIDGLGSGCWGHAPSLTLVALMGNYF